MNDPHSPPPPAESPGPAARRSRGWIWYFLVVVVLAVGAAATLVIYNLGQQLTRERFQTVRKLWEAKGPADYEFRYTFRGGKEAEVFNRHHVVVRGKKVESVTLNDQIRVPARQLRHHSMDALLDFIEDFLDQDEKAKRKVFKVGMFDPRDGHLLRYVRRVTGTTERQEIQVEEFRALDPKARQ